MNPYAIAPLISLILLLAGGFYIIRKGTRRIFNWLFALVVFVLSMMEFGNFMVFSAKDSTGALFWQRWALTALLFLPFCWTLISLIFARENYQELIRKWKWYLTVLFALSLWFLFFIIKKSLITETRVFFKGYGFVLDWSGRNLFLFLLLSLLVILLNFENTYRASKLQQKQAIKYAIRGIGVFLGAYVVLSSLALLFSYIDIRFTVFGSIALITGSLLIIPTIRRSGFAETQVYVGRQAIYTSATLSIVGLYLVMIGLITRLFMKVGFNLTSFLSFLAAFFVFFLFILIIFTRSLTQRLRLFIDRSFYKDKYDYRREWANLNERLSTILNVGELITEVKRLVKQVLGVDSTEVVLLELASLRGGELNSLINGKFETLAEWLLRYGEPISIAELSKKQPYLFEDNRCFLEKLGAYLLVSLNAKQKLLGILTVGKKQGQRAFSHEDTEFLKLISRQVSVAILNVRLSEELIVSREMEHFHRLSSFLIHDLKNLVSMLSLVLQNAKENFDKPEFRQDALSTVSHTVARMNRLMQKLSTLPKELELRPHLADLNTIVEEAIEKANLKDNRQIKLVKELNGLPLLMIDSEYMEKVIFNLILNAVEAMPRGGTLRIGSRLQEVGASNGRYAELSVSDTGCGMSREFIDKQLFKPFQSTKNKGLGVGLFQSKTIVEAHKGKIEVQSQPNQGTTLVVKLPVSSS